jgi:hypothetical protein
MGRAAWPDGPGYPKLLSDFGEMISAHTVEKKKKVKGRREGGSKPIGTYIKTKTALGLRF